MRILFIGDIVGKPGVELACRVVPMLREREQLDLVAANAENASGGAGLLPAAFRRLHLAGIDAFTMGDHIYKKADLIRLLEDGAPICKPANFPPGAPGSDLVVTTARDGTPVGVASVLGRLFMRPVDCPFRAVEGLLPRLRARCAVVLLDVHAEATAEKALLGRYCDGRVSAVLGTHTHVPTADEQIFPGGTAFITDVGMTGPYHSILGRRIDRVLFTTTTFIPSPFDVADEDVRLAGAIVEIEPATGKASAIRRIMVKAEEASAIPPA